jgi:predicted dithiol-disulfide oxidoreductase (DUF899 family)
MQRGSPDLDHDAPPVDEPHAVDAHDTRGEELVALDRRPSAREQKRSTHRAIRSGSPVWKISSSRYRCRRRTVASTRTAEIRFGNIHWTRARSEIGGEAMTRHKVATQEEWQAARDELLAEEKELTRRNDELARKRRELPWVEVEQDYSFETDDGTKSLAELFDGRSQLLIYHFMFGPAYTAGCPVCSSIADNLDPNAVHLAARDVKLMLVSRAPLEKLQAYKQRMGWSLDWASTVGGEFNRELGFLYTEEELKPFLEGDVPRAVEEFAEACGVDAAAYVSEGPGLSAYILSKGTVYRTYVTTTRGLEPAMGYYSLLDRTPMGRNEEDAQILWLRRHDEYQDAS